MRISTVRKVALIAASALLLCTVGWSQVVGVRVPGPGPGG